MAHTHEYDCIVCGAHLETQDELTRHNKENHLRGAKGMERPRQKGSEFGDESDKSRSQGNGSDDRRF